MAATARFEPVTHVIFDLDGLILDTDAMYGKWTSELVGRYGKEFPFHLKLRVLGSTPRECARLIVEELQLPISPERYERDFAALASAAFPEVELLPGVERLVRHLHYHDVPMAVATGSDQEGFDLKTQRHRSLMSLFQHWTLGSHVTRGKPHPDIFMACIQKFQPVPEPRKVLVLEDAPNGVEGAKACGCQSVLIPDPRVNHALRKSATLCLDSMEDFRPELFGLPPF